MLQTSSGEILIVSDDSDPGNPGYPGTYFIRVDKDGNKLWDKKISGKTVFNKPYCSVELIGGDALTCSDITGGRGNIVLYKTDKSGNLTWQKTIDDACLGLHPYSLVVNADGTYTITGTATDYCHTTNGSYTDYVLVLKVDAGGNTIWMKKHGRKGYSWGYHIFNDGTVYIITGNTNCYDNSTSPGNDNMFVMRVDANGDVIL
jgi:hypothetical protein